MLTGNKLSEKQPKSPYWPVLLCVFAVLSACSSDLPQSIDLPPVEPPPPPPPEQAQLLVLRTARWPGGGRELTVGVLNQATRLPFASDLSGKLLVQPPSGMTLQTKVSKVSLPIGYTAILLPPKLTAVERKTLGQALRDFVVRRPAQERIALYRHGAQVQLFANFLAKRQKLSDALSRYENGPDGDSAPLPLVSAMGPVASDLEQVGGVGPDVMRSLIVLSKEPASTYTGLSQVFSLAVTPDTAGLAQAGQAIDAVRQQAFYKLAVCGPTDKFSAKLRLDSLGGELDTSFPYTLPEELTATCTPAAIDSAKRTYTQRIELLFDATQRTEYQRRLTATQSGTFDEALAKSDFATGVRLAPGQPVLQATAHLRGNSSLSCARKSHVIQLDGPDRFFMPNSATDEITLISMCDDSAYVYSPTVYRMLYDELFPLASRFVELVIDGTTNGIYLMVEKTKEELIRDNARTMSVMRRDYPQNGADFFEVEYSHTEDINAPANRYKDFTAAITPLSGDALIADMNKRMDLDQYLSFLAHQSVLQSGDYIDEMYFFGSEQADGLGGTTETYRVMAWDPEGYRSCHSGGVNAYPDPYQLAFCAEAKLDFKLLADPKVYALFVNKLEEALATTLTQKRMADQFTQTKLELQSWLTNPSICAAMKELLKLDPGAANCTVAQNLIAARATAILSAYEARRTLLLGLIAAYRGN